MKSVKSSIKTDAEKIVEYLSKPNIERLIWLMDDSESSLIKLLKKEENENIKDDLFKSLMEIRMYLSLLTYLQRLFVFHNDESFTKDQMNCLLGFANSTSSFLDSHGAGPIYNNKLYNRSLKSDFFEHVFSEGSNHYNVDQDFIQRIEMMSEIEFEILVLIAFETVYTDRSVMKEFWLHSWLVIDETDDQECADGKDNHKADA